MARWRLEEYAGEINKIIEYSGLKYRSLLLILLLYLNHLIENGWSHQNISMM
jgi:hypothetical protein